MRDRNILASSHRIFLTSGILHDFVCEGTALWDAAVQRQCDMDFARDNDRTVISPHERDICPGLIGWMEISFGMDVMDI
jgi:hypothetical protein